MANTYTLISSNVLTGSAASVTFSSIPNTYTDLVLRITARGDNASVTQNTAVIFNSVTSAQYSDTMLQAYGTGVGSYRVSSQAPTSLNMFNLDGATATANTFGTAEIYIPNYAGSANKCYSTFSAAENNSGTANAIEAVAYLWSNTATITSITIQAGSNPNNWVSGSSFYLYGIKNT